jgi:mono/diheme cytochrome c family protein
MLLSVLWMFWQDYHREFKAVQRDFRDVEEALSERQMLEALPEKSAVDERRNAVAESRANLKKTQDDVAPTEKDITVRRDLQDNAYRLIKADFDSRVSYLNIAREHVGKAADPAERQRAEKQVQDLEQVVQDLGTRLAEAQKKLDAIDQEYKEKVRGKLEGPEQALAAAEDSLKRLTAPFDRFAKSAAQKRWKFGDTFRALPIIDAFESPTKIKQTTLPDLTIDYGGFKDVPRYDRCITCHLGIERGAFSKASLLALRDVPDGLTDKLKTAREILAERKKTGEDLGFDPGDLPRDVRKINLTDGQVTQFAGHPRLDLFVDSNSAHPAEKFGCTACHDGQGSATDFLLAAHSPADARQMEEWRKEYGWDASHFWDFPMMSSRFVESGCVKCHYQMTDLIRHGSKEEAPKLLRGYNLVKEFGCFGCHEISGIKSGRQVGPDLRAEPTPALEYLSAAEQDRAKADPLNPPGTLRKVGPSLRRLAEKTNQEWTRKWVQAPRDFRPDTRMPHFYGLSNNNEEVLKGTVPDQRPFPATEIHSITYYLIAESQGHLKGQDTVRQTLERRVKELQGILKQNLLAERNWKDLLEVSRRLADLGILSAPMRSREINAESTRQRQLQDRLQELLKRKLELESKDPKEELSAEEAKDLKEAGDELDKVTAHLITLAKPVPLSQELIDEEGTAVKLPERSKDEKELQKHRDNGRRLFTERGCLACHSHEGTTKAAEGVPAVDGQAVFGPNLSRVAAKIQPELSAEEAKDPARADAARRRWLVQWVMNPNVHHPRTRMPITHLKPEDAADIAEWLLSQKVTDWNEADPKAPAMADLIMLARVYLGKAPGMTPADVDAYLPDPGKTDAATPPGIPQERLDNIAKQSPEADELRLTAPVTEDKLKWYIGRKAISRLGCFGCHDLPGFETAKPIGTALNDWGRKDPERLAFEDVDTYVRKTHNIVPLRMTKKDIEERVKALEEKEQKGGLTKQEKARLEELRKQKPWEDVKEGNQVKTPIEEFFFYALEHHHREGFLHQKLNEPRSYDYERDRTWDDRLRMPQFRFANRVRRHADESDEDFRARQEKEEAEAREAVMTFILGLVAEPVALRYVYNPDPDRLAEVQGQHVLDKFNCAGCHQIRPGVYQFRATDEELNFLKQAYDVASRNFPSDHVFMGHNAWVGAPQASPDRMVAYGVSPKLDEENFADRKMLVIRLADALRFVGPDRVVRDLRGGDQAFILPETILSRSDTYGGLLADLLVPYLEKKYTRFSGKPDDARSTLPPPLVREGERVQPNWLYGFLLNPPPIRPESYMMLRMPKFNMSEADAQALVNYFSSVSRRTNPGAGITASYLKVRQRDDHYWEEATKEYVKRLEEKGQLKGRLEQMRPLWEAELKKRQAAVDASLEAARQAAKETKEAEARKQKEGLVKSLEEEQKKLKEQVDKKDYSALEKRWKSREAYASDAYRLLTNPELCLKCHSVGDIQTLGEQGPNLALTADRLRPEWTEQWIANPTRLFTYPPNMPQNFPKNSLQYQEFFVAPTSLDQVRAVRDVLMDLPRLKDLPGNGARPPAPAGGAK